MITRRVDPVTLKKTGPRRPGPILPRSGRGLAPTRAQIRELARLSARAGRPASMVPTTRADANRAIDDVRDELALRDRARWRS